MKAMVQQLKELLGSDFDLLVEAYDVDNRQHLVSARSFIEQGDSENVRKVIHSIKGASANIGAENLANLCQVLESSSKDGNLDGASAQLDQIEVLFNEAVDVLRSA